MKTLYLMRHAKSSWSTPGLNDSQRPLNDRGKKAAPFMGKILKKMNEMPELIVTSSAKRACSTAKRIAEKLSYPLKKILNEEKLYMAGRDEFLSVIAQTGNNINKLMLISHNPGITDFANSVSGENIENIPTAGIVRIDFDVNSWDNIKETKGKFIFFEYPKKYSSQFGI